jgi:N-acetylneuraminic acid mutarotase
MKPHGLLKIFSGLTVLGCLGFFLACSGSDNGGGNPTLNPPSGEIRISGALISAGPSYAPARSDHFFQVSKPLAGYTLSCTTATTPPIEATGRADASGKVTVVFRAGSEIVSCSVLNLTGYKVASLLFSDPLNTARGEKLSASGAVDLGTIMVNADSGVAKVVVAQGAMIADAAPPETQITSKPPDPDSRNSAEFGFTCNKTPCEFQCQLDAGQVEDCTAPKSYLALENGRHRFAVKAADEFGNANPVPTVYTWNISANPPETIIDSSPPDPSNQNNVSFDLSCAPGPCTFECKMDADDWSVCASPASYSALANGIHTFLTRAVDEEGNRAVSPAGLTWEVRAAAPQTFLTTKPTNPSRSNSANFIFTCRPGPCTYECNLDNAGFSPCQTPKTYTRLSYRFHNFKVRAISEFGNIDPNSRDYTWRIEMPNLWISSSTAGAPSARKYHTAVWTGSEMVVWGGGLGWGETCFYTGGRYDPMTDSWTPLFTGQAPEARIWHTAVWTGKEMIVWGGYNYDGAHHYLNSGGRYNPSIDSWYTTSVANAPGGRYGHTAIWTGSEMIIWGGGQDNTGGRYNPSSDTWIGMAAGNAPSARKGHTSVWTGTEMIVWGGQGAAIFNNGAAFSPATGTWQAISASEAPAARTGHTAVWTGSQMIVWGGWDGNYYMNDGGRYEPAADSWLTMYPSSLSPRASATALWTGSVMIVWGGSDSSLAFNSGARYNPVSNYWAETAAINAPAARADHTAVWTGTEMIIWGGGIGLDLLNSGALYVP